MNTKLAFLITAMLLLTGANTYSQSCKVDYSITYDYVPGTLVKNKSNKHVYIYNGSGQNTEINSYLWSDSLNQWQDWRHTVNTFNGSGQLTEAIESYWMNATSTWTIQYRSTSQYNGTGSVSQYLHQIYNNGTWINDYKIDCAFNSANDTLQEVRQNWASGTWENYYTIDYTYNLDTLVQRTLKIWDVNTWKNTWKEDYTYNAQNLREKETFYKTYSNGGYYFSKRTTYTYNGNNQKTEVLAEEWSQALDYWDLPYKFTYTYNNDGCLIKDNTLKGNGGSGFNNLYETEYYRGALGIADGQQTHIQCFPNPAANYITIQAGPETNLSKLQIANTMGQLMPVEYLSGSGTSKTINVQSFSRGVYFLHGKNIAVKFVKE